jgi:outer membrane protein OmpA-like peptidoglycan-associated protein
VTTTFTVRAIVPFAPTIIEVTPGNATISVDFVAGLSGGASITTYSYSVNDGETWTQWPDGTTTSPLVITNVPNSIESKVRIAAVNRVGRGVRSNLKTATPKSPVWEVERKSNTAFSISAEPSVISQSTQLPPRPALVRTKSVQRGRRTQVTATRAAKDFNIPVTHAIITVRLKNGRLLARIQVRVDPNNPTTSVTVPYKSSLVKISVQFANDIGVSAGGTAGANLREGTTFLATTINGRPRLAGTPVPGGVRFAKGSSTLSSTAKAMLRKSLKTVQARGGLIYVTGYANSGETKSSWMLETLARKRAENVSKYLISVGARQWITFYGAPTAPTTWHTSRTGHVDIATVGLDQI